MVRVVMDSALPIMGFILFRVTAVSGMYRFLLVTVTAVWRGYQFLFGYSYRFLGG